MKFSVLDRYMTVPVAFAATQKKLSFFLEGTRVLEMDVHLDYIHPDALYYADMQAFLGQDLTMVCEPDIPFEPCFVSKMDNTGVYQEKYRPKAHFSARRGWINDPNGLFYYKGQYHIFYQHNPYGRDWGNMHWGHAVSEDLMHWRELGETLCPDETGMVFSGSAYVDTENITGLCNGVDDPILLFYTAGGGYTQLSKGRSFTQAVAYSTDGGDTFMRCTRNPIVNHLYEDNRDPKVVRDPASGLYYMALYLGDCRFMLLTSKDLLSWSRGQELVLSDDMECPDLYRLNVEGEDGVGWVFTGANGRYLIGQLCNGAFKLSQAIRRLHYGKSCYAAQTFVNLDPRQKRVVRMAWNRSDIPGTCFAGAMCTPAEMKLRRINGDLLLCIQPVAEIAALYGEVLRQDAFDIPENSEALFAVQGAAQDIVVEVASEGAPDFSIDLLGMEIQVAPSKNRLQVGEDTMPLCECDGVITLRILTDTNGLEIYAHQGEAFFCGAHVSDYTLSRLRLCTKSPALQVRRLQIAMLKDIWRDPS